MSLKFLLFLADNCRPYLMTQVDRTTDYINAVFVNVRIIYLFILSISINYSNMKCK